MRSFKPGAFRIAIASQLPVVPFVVFMSGLMKTGRKRLHHMKIVVKVLPPIETKRMAIDQAQQLADSTRELMLRTLRELYAKYGET